MLLAIAVTVVWGINFVVIEVGLGSFPPLLFAGMRFTLLVFPAIFFVRRPAVRLRWLLGVGLFMSTGQFALLFVAMNAGMTAGLASVVLQLQAIFTIALAALFLGERPAMLQLAGAAVAVAGIAVIGAGRSHGVPLVGFLLCVGAAGSWAVGNICNRKAQSPDAFALLVWSSLVPPLPLFTLSLIFEGPHRISHALAHLALGGFLSLLYVVVVSTAFGFGGWTWLLRRHPASRVAPFTLLVPPVGIVTAWIARGERPGAAEVAGTLLALAGLALVTSASRLRSFLASRMAMPDTGSSISGGSDVSA